MWHDEIKEIWSYNLMEKYKGIKKYQSAVLKTRDEGDFISQKFYSSFNSGIIQIYLKNHICISQGSDNMWIPIKTVAEELHHQKCNVAAIRWRSLSKHELKPLLRFAASAPS